MTRTLLRRLSLLAFLLLTFAIQTVAAEEGQIYTIKKGDTLWDLSQRFMNDPYYWPNVWSKNPQITNPHLIFPGQKIRILDGRLEIIPAFTESDTKGEATIPAATPQAEQMTVKVSGDGQGFILTDEKPLGLLVDSVDNRVLLTKNDLVFVKMNNLADVNIGDTYSLYERGKKIRHPKKPQTIGTMMHNLGYLQVTEIHDQTVMAKIVGCYQEITRGAELFEYVPPRREIVLRNAASAAPGYLVAGRIEKSTISTNDIVYIDLGARDGAQPGNLMYLSRPRQVSNELIKKAGPLQLPDEVLGAAVIIESRPTTSSAIVIKNVKEAQVGDQIELVNE